MIFYYVTNCDVMDVDTRFVRGGEELVHTYDRNKRTKQNTRNDKLHLIIETHNPEWDILLNTHKEI